MAYYIYSVESFPSPTRPGEFIEVNRQRIAVEAGKWTKLNPRYEFFQYTDYQDNQGRIDTFADWQMAEEIARLYGHRGVVVLQTDDINSAREREAKEREALAANRAHRKTIIEAFQLSRRERLVGGQGRIHPTPYEAECFDVLGVPVPDTLEEVQAARSPVNVTLSLPPEVVAAIRASGAPEK